MATIKLREINPVVFNNNVGLGDVSPGERLVINSGSIKMDHANGGQGIFFQSLSTSGNNSSLRWSNSVGTERFRLIVDPDSDKTDRLQINSNNNNTNCLTILQDGKIGIGTGSTAPTEILTINSASNTRILLQEAGSDRGSITAGGSGLYIRNLSGRILFRNSSDVDTMAIWNDGKVGIGTGSTAPADKLQVKDGAIRLTDSYAINWDGNNILLHDGTDTKLGDGSASDIVTVTGGKVGIGTGSTGPSTILNIHGADPIVRIVGTTSDDNATIQLLEAQDIPKFGFELQYDGTGDNRFYIKKYNGSLTADVVLAIDRGTGDVGIGTGATLPAAKLDIYKQEGLLPVINARRGKDGGRIRLSYGSTTDNYGEIGMTSYSSGSRIWIGSNMNSFAASGHSSPAHADVDNATWFSAWDSNSDQYTIERIPNGQTAPAIMFSIDSDGRVNIPIANLPTSDTGLSAGDLYRSGTSLLIKTS